MQNCYIQFNHGLVLPQLAHLCVQLQVLSNGLYGGGQEYLSDTFYTPAIQNARLEVESDLLREPLLGIHTNTYYMPAF